MAAASSKTVGADRPLVLEENYSPNYRYGVLAGIEGNVA